MVNSFILDFVVTACSVHQGRDILFPYIGELLTFCLVCFFIAESWLKFVWMQLKSSIFCKKKKRAYTNIYQSQSLFFSSVCHEENQRSGSGGSDPLPRMPCRPGPETEAGCPWSTSVFLISAPLIPEHCFMILPAQWCLWHLQVMQTLSEAEQVCAELQHSVSGLDSRLAELLHWETEARELYQLLRAAERQQQRGQDPRARVRIKSQFPGTIYWIWKFFIAKNLLLPQVLISRGLQLEGQVVTEEQDLQVMVMTNQKNSPIQYLHASAMQDRVRAAVAQSQVTTNTLNSNMTCCNILITDRAIFL